MKSSIKACLVLIVFAWTAPVDAQVIRYYHTDITGSVVAVTDENANVIERRVYEPYGLPQTPVPDGPGYTGHDMDGETGLVYMQQRYYDPLVGRFMSVDAVTAYDGDLRHFNRYSYAYNNPYSYTDPDGRCPSCLGAFIGGGLELGFQLSTTQGREAYLSAGGALARKDYASAVHFAGANVAKVAASAAAGAIGAGLAGKFAQGANLISQGINSSSATGNVAANVGIRVGGNAVAGASLGAATQGAGNAVDGQPLTQGMTGAAIAGGIGGALGAGIEVALTPAAQNLANATGRAIGSAAGVAVPGGTGSATVVGERAGAIGGAAMEKAANCARGAAC